MSATSASAHGTDTRYDYGCRCEQCTKAHRARCAAVTVAMKERGQRDPSLIPHGTRGGYINWGCRCERCTEANSQACRLYAKTGSYLGTPAGNEPGGAA